MAFRTGACRATQPILRCPSGARAGSLTMDSSIMALFPVCSTSLTAAHCAQFTGQGGGLLPLSAALLEHARERLRAIGHDDVHPKVEQAAHLAGLVYRPRVHPHAPRVSRPQKARGDQRDPLVFDGHLERVAGRTAQAQALQAQTAQEVERSRLQPGCPRGDPTAGDPAEAPHNGMIAGDDERAPLGAGVPYDPHDGLLGARLGLFYVDVHANGWKLLVDLRERRYPEPLAAVGVRASPFRAEAVAGVERAELVQLHLGDDTGTIRGALHGRVVDNDDLLVEGHVDVEFQPTGSRLNRQPEGLQSVPRS